MIPKDKGWGMSNLGLWEKNPCVTTLFCLPPSLVSSNPFNVLFWSGFQSEKEDQSKKRQMNKLHSLVKRLKKEVIVESVEENAQVESSAQKLKEPVCGEQRKVDEYNQIEVSEDVEEVQATGLKQEEEKKSVEHDQEFTDIQENITDVFVTTKLEDENIQIPRRSKEI